MGRRKKELSVDLPAKMPAALAKLAAEAVQSAREEQLAAASLISGTSFYEDEDEAPESPEVAINIKALWGAVCSCIKEFADANSASWQVNWPNHGKGMAGNVSSRDRKTQKIYVRAPKTWLGNDDITAAEAVVYLNLNLHLPVKVDLYIPQSITRNGGAILGLALILEQAAELVTALNNIDADDFRGVQDPEDTSLLSYKNADDEDETVVADAGVSESQAEDKASQKDSVSTGGVSATPDVEVEDFF